MGRNAIISRSEFFWRPEGGHVASRRDIRPTREGERGAKEALTRNIARVMIYEVGRNLRRAICAPFLIAFNDPGLINDSRTGHALDRLIRRFFLSLSLVAFIRSPSFIGLFSRFPSVSQERAHARSFPRALSPSHLARENSRRYININETSCAEIKAAITATSFPFLPRNVFS